MSDFLYLIATLGRSNNATGPVKVGVTSSLRSRLKMIQTGCPRPIAYYRIWDFKPTPGAARYFEDCFHELQHASRLSGEWHGLSPIDAAMLLDICIKEYFILRGVCTREEATAFGMTGLIPPEIDRFGRLRSA